ncbi:hypothetical protein [Aeoliella sp. SH292]|uniref:hypothetical protein n=1 Tax=Aeoliella sp. SH292 TaxID=3454464 RepID=UPI003F9D6517
MQMDTRIRRFTIAPFAIDGELMGVGAWDENLKSDLIVHLCSELLDDEGPVFQKSLDGEFGGIELQFASCNGAAIATFCVGSTVASSAMFLSGQSNEVDRQVTTLFTNSIRSSSQRIVGSLRSDAFEAISELSEFPLLIVVPWGNELIDDAQYAHIQELCLHLAAVYFSRQLGVS